MDEDASLDDFLDAADDQEAEPDESDDDVPRDDGASGAGAPDESEDVGDAIQDADASEDVEDAVRRDPSAVEPAGATYDWTPGGAACEACDEVVERRWRDESGFVCEDCKDW